MAGFMSAAAQHRRTLLLDGFVATAAALIVAAIEPNSTRQMLAAHRSAEPGHAGDWKNVEELFVRTGRIWHLHVGGELIRTTGGHPFSVVGKGWLAARLLQAGDLLCSRDGRTLAVEECYDTQEYETVYNLRIADYHTYFVGGSDGASRFGRTTPVAGLNARFTSSLTVLKRTASSSCTVSRRANSPQPRCGNSDISSAGPTDGWRAEMRWPTFPQTVLPQVTTCGTHAGSLFGPPTTRLIRPLAVRSRCTRSRTRLGCKSMNMSALPGVVKPDSLINTTSAPARTTCSAARIKPSSNNCGQMAWPVSGCGNSG